MKIAYIGYDLTCLKTAGFFKKADYEVEYFIKEKKQVFPYKPFHKTDIFFENVMMPSLETERTSIQTALFKDIENDYRLMENAVGSSFYKQNATDEKLNWTQDVTVSDLSTLFDIQPDPKKRKVFLEIDKVGSEPFDYLLTEAHPLLSDYLENRKISLFKKRLTTDYIWSSICFDIDYLKPLTPLEGDKTFFTVMDVQRKSLVDNWFFCHLKENTLHVWSFQPANQISNPEFQNFYIDRVRQYMSVKFPFVHIKNYQSSYLTTVGPENEEAKIKVSQSLAVPNFTYWSLNQIHGFFEARLDKKLKKLKKQTEAHL